MTDPLTALGLLSSLFVTLASALDRVRGTPKQRFAKELFALFDIFGEVESSASAFISDLRAFRNEPDIGMRVHIIHGTGTQLRELERACEDFIRWMESHKEWMRVLQLYAPHAVHVLDRLIIAETLGPSEDNPERYPTLYDVGSALNAMEKELQAVESPNPELFPQLERLAEIIDQIEELRSETQHARRLIREYAIASLSIEDVFR